MLFRCAIAAAPSRAKTKLAREMWLGAARRAASVRARERAQAVSRLMSGRRAGGKAGMG